MYRFAGYAVPALSLNHTSPNWKHFVKDTENPVVKPIPYDP